MITDRWKDHTPEDINNIIIYVIYVSAYTYLLQIYVLFLSWWLSSSVKISGKGWQAT